MKNTDKLNFGVSIASILVSITALLVAVRAINSNEEIAQKSGNFDKPEIRLDFGNFITPTSVDTIPLIYGINFEKKDVDIAPLPFQLSNIGKKDAEDLKLIIQYPTIGHIAIDHKDIKSQMPAFAALNRIFDQNSGYDLITYSANKVNPGLSMNIHEPIVLRETKILTEVSKTNISILHSFPVVITILGKDIEPQKKVFSLRCLNIDVEEKLISEYIKNIPRRKKQSLSIFFVLPEKEKVFETKEGNLNDYKIGNKDLHCAMIQDTSPNQDMSVALYDMNNKLDKIMIFNEKNEYVKTFQIEN